MYQNLYVTDFDILPLLLRNTYYTPESFSINIEEIHNNNHEIIYKFMEKFYNTAYKDMCNTIPMY